tara:strand:+ start:6276 stop:6827 length:552 start_codon:yes stop_codon:yes gene_type:complete
MTTILTKSSDTATSKPTSLTRGSGAELAVNTADQKLYVENSSGAVVEVAPAVNSYPVGSIYMSVTAATPSDVNTILGGGTWEVFGEGRVLVAHSTTDTAFDASSGTTGGNKTTNLTVGQLPAHTHDVQYDNETNMEKQSSGPDHIISELDGTTLTRTTTSTGNGDPVELLQPYISVYMYKRTA